MKQYSFDLGEWHSDYIFCPIRSKKDCIRLLMKTIKIMITNQLINGPKRIGKILLIVSRMSRVFYISETKMFSINFPFYVSDFDGELQFSSDNIFEIDSRMTSQILSFISSNDSFESFSFYDFTDPIIDIVSDNNDFWPFLKKLLIFEDGYIRYDYDLKNDDGLKHPICHYDIFYSSKNTFKIGLKNSINSETFIDLLTQETDCHFIV